MAAVVDCLQEAQGNVCLYQLWVTCPGGHHREKHAAILIKENSHQVTATQGKQMSKRCSEPIWPAWFGR